MFCINIRVACSVFVRFTVSASARALSASPRAFFMALRIVTMAMMAVMRLPPRIRLSISLRSISDDYCLMPICCNHLGTENEGQDFDAFNCR